MTNSQSEQQQTQSGARPFGASSTGDPLHLPSLYISGFRGIDELTLPRLGRVTLFAGDNGVGKTTILDAVRLYAARGSISAITSLLDSREEFTESRDGEGNWVNNLWWPALFSGGPRNEDQKLEIGPAPEASGGRGLVIETVTLDEDSDEVKHKRRETGGGTSGSFFKTVVRFDGEEWRLHKDELQEAKPAINLASEAGRAAAMERRDPLPYTNCVSVGPGLPDNDDLARHWDEIALTTFESIAVDILKTVVGPNLERVGVIGKPMGPLHKTDRLVVARLTGDRERMPLKGLGDGALRFFGFALALTNSINGFLLIDEAENGIHYSHHEEFWRMIIETAAMYNIQVLATTHSFDCIAGFSRAVNSIPGEHGMLIRLDKGEDGKLNVAEYTEDLLKITEEMGIEVR